MGAAGWPGQPAAGTRSAFAKRAAGKVLDSGLNFPFAAGPPARSGPDEVQAGWEGTKRNRRLAGNGCGYPHCQPIALSVRLGAPVSENGRNGGRELAERVRFDDVVVYLVLKRHFPVAGFVGGREYDYPE